MNEAKKEKLIQLRADGQSYRKIASALNVSKQTFINWSKNLQEDLNNETALRLDEIREKYLQTKESRARACASLLQKMEGELIQRDLTSIPTDKLLTMTERVQDRVNDLLRPEFEASEDLLSQVLENSRQVRWSI